MLVEIVRLQEHAFDSGSTSRRVVDAVVGTVNEEPRRRGVEASVGGEVVYERVLLVVDFGGGTREMETETSGKSESMRRGCGHVLVAGGRKSGRGCRADRA